MERGLLPGAGWLLFVLLLVSFVLFFFFSFLFFFLFQSGNKRRIKALLSCGAVGWVFWRFIQTVVSIQPDFFELVDSFVSIGWKGVVGPGVFIFFFPCFY